MSFEADAPANARRKRLVLDANILIRAVLGTRVFTLLDTYADRVDLLTAQEAFDDARTYLPEILARRGFTQTETDLALDAVDQLARLVTAVPEAAYAELEETARQRLAGRDEEDWPYLALALLFDCPIWTEDQDFFGSGVPTWITSRIQLYLDK